MIAARASRSWSPGADGFIGSHLVERLVARGRRRPRVLPLQLARLGGLAGRGVGRRPRPALDIRFGDIRDARFVERGDRGRRGRVPPRRADRDPVLVRRGRASFVDTNVRGTLNVLEAAGRAGVRRLIHTSTSEVYGTPETLPDPRDAPAQRPVAVRGDQGRRRPARARVPPQLRPAGRRPAPVQHLRPAPVRAGGRCRRCSASCWPAQREIRLGRLDTRRDLTFVADTVDGLRAGRGRPPASTAGRSSSGPGGPRASARCSSSRGASPAATRRSSSRRGAPAARRQRGARRSSPTRRSRASCWAGRRPRPRGRARGDDRVAAEPARPRHGRDPCPALSRGSRSPNRRSGATRGATSTSASARTSCRRSGRSSPGSRRRSPPSSAPRYAVACASGTAAIHLAMLRARRRRRATRSSSRRSPSSRRPTRCATSGATPVFVDSERRDLQPRSRRSSSASWTGGRGPGAGSPRRSRSSTCWAIRPTSSRSSTPPSATACR